MLAGNGTASTRSDIETQIASRERALHVELPRSYLDFVRAYRPRGNWKALKTEAGFLSIDQIDTVARLDPEGVELARKTRVNVNDAPYLVYGVQQDDATMRTAYLPDAIVVGKHGVSLYEQIVLFPQVRTRDGEMEAAALYWSGAYRAPSFAELMRQLHVLDLGREIHMPPYPQERLRGTCADRMPLRDVWWK